MRRFLLLSCLIAAICGAALAGGPVIVGASGGDADAPSTQQETRTAAAAEPSTTAAPPDDQSEPPAAPVADAPVAVATEAQEPSAPEAAEREAPARMEELWLHCRGIVTEERHGVACEWSQAVHPRFAGYRLVRGDGDERVVVFRTDDRGVTRFLDREVEPGVRYHYVIQEVDADGRVIGSGGPAIAGIPPRDHEQLRLACERASHEDARGIACVWSEAQRDDARGYVLFRSIDGGERVAIHRSGLEGPKRYFDAPLRPGHRYTYAVVLLDGDGNVIGGGGPVTVGIPPPGDEPER